MLKDILTDDWKKAMVSKDFVARDAIQMVRTSILNFEKNSLTVANDSDIIEIISKELKKRRDSYQEYQKSGREDLISNLKREIDILLKYLPKQLSTDELNEIVRSAISEANASTVKDMGKVMGLVAPKIKGRADTKMVSEIVKSMLNIN